MWSTDIVKDDKKYDDNQFVNFIYYYVHIYSTDARCQSQRTDYISRSHKKMLVTDVLDKVEMALGWTCG